MTPKEIALCKKLKVMDPAICDHPAILRNPDGPAAAAMITALVAEREGLATRVAELEAVMKMHGKRLRDERSSRWDELS